MRTLFFSNDPTQSVFLPNVLYPKNVSTYPASRDAHQLESALLPSLLYVERRSSLQAAHGADCTDPLEKQLKHSDGLSCPEPDAYPAPEAPCPDNSLPLAFRRVESGWSVSLAVHPSRAAGRVGTPSFAMILAAADRARPRGVRLEARTPHCLSG